MKARIMVYIALFFNALYDYPDLSHTWYVFAFVTMLISIDLYEWHENKKNDILQREQKAMELIKEAQDRWEKHLETTNSLCNIKKEDNEKLH